jgi:hypothetical protein
MIQPLPQEMQAEGAPMMHPGLTAPVWSLVPHGMVQTGTLLTLETALKLSGPLPRPAHTFNVPHRPSLIAIEDWDALFCAVQTQLKRAVGEQLGILPLTPAHSTELAATLVQATVLDCVGALDQLHAALKQERGQRPAT